MTAALRPMNLGEILDRTFEIYRNQFLLFFGIAALPALAILAIHAADNAWLHSNQLVHTYNRGGAVLWNSVVGLAYYHISGFFNFLVMPAAVRSCSKAIFGDRTSLVSALRFAATRWRSYISIAILKLLAELVIPEVLVLGLMLGMAFAEDKLGLLNGHPGIPVVLVLLSPVLIVAFLFPWLGACLALAYPVAVLEHLTGVKALRRSWKLSRGGRLRIAFTWLSLIAMTSIVAFSLQLLNRWLAFAIYTATHLRFYGLHFYYGVAYLLNALVAAGVGPVFPIAVVLFYYDQRVRREAFDLEKMMEAAGLSAPAPGEDEEKSPEAQETAPESI